MTDDSDTRAASGDSHLTSSLERVWEEIKEISRQVERETRRSGRIARLRLDVRQLRRDVSEAQSRLGEAVYEAQASRGDDLPLSELEGFEETIRELDQLFDRIEEKRRDIEELRAAAEATDAGEPAPVGGDAA